MRDMGVTLASSIKTPSFRQNWRQRSDLRENFFRDIGLSALNLIDVLHVAHSDIRLANIAIRDDSFCLIDFDMARQHLTPGAVWKGLSNGEVVHKLFSVAQIALSIFIVDTDGICETDLVELRTYWLENHAVMPPSQGSRTTKLFLDWLSKRPAVQQIFPRVEVTLQNPSSLNFTAILRSILNLP